jgi:hypothetical protein
MIRLAAALSGAAAANLTGSLGVLIAGDLVLAHWQRRAPWWAFWEHDER